VDSELLNFLAATVIILVAAKVAGYASIRIGQPSVLGELLVGIILGPTVLNMLGAWPLLGGDEHLAASLTLFAEIGVILLMFLAGLELDLRDLLRSGRVAATGGHARRVVPLAGGFITSRLFGIETVEAIFIGLALSATSVSISAQTLMELGVLRSKVGLGLLGAAVFDDILVVLLLSGASVVFGANDSGAGIGVILLRMVLFLVGGSAVGLYVMPWLMARAEKLPVSQAVPRRHWCSASCSPGHRRRWAVWRPSPGRSWPGCSSPAPPTSTITSKAAWPLWPTLCSCPSSWSTSACKLTCGPSAAQPGILAIALTVVAIISKVAGSGLGALAGGFNRRDSLRLGVGMISRGEVGLIVASVALRADC
jgi:Kef-type K+ transport system membrane component KefB